MDKRTIRWSFNEGQHEQLTQVILRAAMESRLQGEYNELLYDWHLCRTIELDAHLVDILLDYTDDMLCDYVGINERISDDPSDYVNYKEAFAHGENWSNLQAVELILERAKAQLSGVEGTK